MDDQEKLKQFPDIKGKLNAPKKISVFERQRQEAESKRLREEAETRKALRDFEDSFLDDDDDDDDDPIANIAAGRGFGDSVPTGPRGAGGQYWAVVIRTVGFRTERRLKCAGEFDDDEDDDHQARGRERNRTPEEAVRKPTILLSSLPSGTTKEQIKALMPDSLKVDDVTFVDPPKSATGSQPSLTAIVTAAASTPVSEVDKVVSSLQNRYLGFGFNLNISRHISSTTATYGRFSSKCATTGFAGLPPPASYAPTGPGQAQRYQGPVQVPVAPPYDIKQLKLIHRTVEQLIEYGPEFEAVLMSDADVQKDEKWAWLYDASSAGGVWYRWLIWKYFSEDRDNWNEAQEQGVVDVGRNGNESHYPFDNGPAWLVPAEKPRYEFTTSFEEFVDDSEYVSSDDESGDEGVQRQYNTGHGAVSLEDGPSDGTQARYLNPYRRAKFTYLLARLPGSMALLRVGDVARVTNFVVNNAGNGAEEIVDMLITNVEQPFNSTVGYGDDEQVDERNEDTRKDDLSNSKLIGLYLISDALQAASTSGVRDAWKYRGMFEAALLSRGIFAHLGRMEKDLQWGRMKAEQWKRKVGVVLDLWRDSSVFPKEAQAKFRDSFNNPPLTAAENKAAEEAAKSEEHKRETGRWKDANEDKDKASGHQEQDVRSSQPSLTGDKSTGEGQTSAANSHSVQNAESNLTPATKRVRPRAEDLMDLQDDAPKTQSKLPPGAQPVSSAASSSSTYADAHARIAAMKARLNLQNTAKSSPEAKPADQAAAPAAPKLNSGISFSMSLGSGAGAAPQAKSKPSGAERTEGPQAEDMFGESDAE
ncbi:hypothetical protein H2203_000759 [Taxawa tesnikishii (nom. ined.)]|nr:hypothetical protein H2203_000759 [Dothideales sp. JES 119]